MKVEEKATDVAPPAERLPEHTAGPQSFAWWGMVWLIATEATLFAALLATYFYLRFKAGPVWPPEGIDTPGLALPLIMSAILLSSSIPVHYADAGVRDGSQRRLRAGLAVGFLLGAIFLGLTWGAEWPEKLHEFTPTTNSYGSLFFTITGFHSLHLVVGLAFSFWTQVRAWRGAFDQERHLTVQLFAMYWHFVDVVWVFVLATIYLSPRL
ncbi:MAG: cytochrome c oxidase subunit 3 [Actinomycetota bacterium]